MGLILSNLFNFLISIFEVVGEATISLWKLLVKLIVLFIKGVNSIVSSIVRLLSFLIRSIISSLNFIHFRFFFRVPKKSKSSKKIRKLRSSVPVSSLVPRQIKAFLLGSILTVLLIAVPLGIFVTAQSLPNPHMLSARNIPVTTKIFDRNGELLYEVYADENRTPVDLQDIPLYFKEATLAIEDQDFYKHDGFSVRGIVRALYSIVKNNEIQGGSTITQQLVRSALLSQEVTIQRKLKELALSVWAERLYTKDEILEMYFNQVPYGGTAWGAEAAAQTYFGKSIRDVTLPESALLAGLPAAPSLYSPFGSHAELALERQKEVLRRMTEEGYITQREKEDAINSQLTYKRPDIGIHAPHFVMYVKDLLAQKYGLHRVEQGGLRVTTSLDLKLQEKAQETVSQEVSSLSSLNVGNGAVVVTNPQTGEILAMVGSKDYFDIVNEGNVNVALTPQQPGSTIKVVTYAAALQNGYTAATLIQDAPITYRIPGSQAYSPVNYDGKFHGYIPLRQALGNSYNIPAVRTLAKVGLPSMIEEGRKMGITSWKDSTRYGLSLTLGAGEVTMLEMASVYGTLANHGKRVDISPILEVKDYLGNTLINNKVKEAKQAVPDEVAFILSDILSDNSARSKAFGSSSTLNIPGQWIAVKTGTSNEKRDNWAIGYTSNFVVTTWVGNNNNAPMNQVLTSGITGATPIWRKITDYLLTQYPSSSPTPPQTIVSASCRGRTEYFVQGTERNACTPIPTPSADQEKIAENKPELFTVQAEELKSISPIPAQQTQDQHTSSNSKESRGTKKRN